MKQAENLPTTEKTTAPIQEKQSDNTTKMIPLPQAYASYWKKYFVWKERSTRAEYWWPFLLNFVIALVLSALGQVSVAFASILALFQIATIIPNISVLVRRLHDVGHSAWLAFSPILFAFVMGLASGFKSTVSRSSGDVATLVDIAQVVVIVAGFAVLILAIALFVYCCLPGTKGPNKYGEAVK